MSRVQLLCGASACRSFLNLSNFALESLAGPLTVREDLELSKCVSSVSRLLHDLLAKKVVPVGVSGDVMGRSRSLASYMQEALLHDAGKPRAQFLQATVVTLDAEGRHADAAECCVAAASTLREEGGVECSNVIINLWSSAFEFYLLGNNIDGAVTAIVANPDHLRRRDCLRSLTLQLFDRGNVRGLCDVPFVAIAGPGGLDL